MLLLTISLLLLSANCLAKASEYSDIVGTEISSQTAGKRIIRSATLVGKAALNLVLDGARFLYSNGLDKVFVKKGGFKEALRDFDKINAGEEISYREQSLINTKNVKGQKFGKVGDRILILNKDSRTGHTTLSVTQFPQVTGHPDVIASKIILYMH